MQPLDFSFFFFAFNFANAKCSEPKRRIRFFFICFSVNNYTFRQTKIAHNSLPRQLNDNIGIGNFQCNIHVIHTHTHRQTRPLGSQTTGSAHTEQTIGAKFMPMKRFVFIFLYLRNQNIPSTPPCTTVDNEQWTLRCNSFAFFHSSIVRSPRSAYGIRIHSDGALLLLQFYWKSIRLLSPKLHNFCIKFICSSTWSAYPCASSACAASRCECAAAVVRMKRHFVLLKFKSALKDIRMHILPSTTTTTTTTISRIL